MWSRVRQEAGSRGQRAEGRICNIQSIKILFSELIKLENQSMNNPKFLNNIFQFKPKLSWLLSGYLGCHVSLIAKANPAMAYELNLLAQQEIGQEELSDSRQLLQKGKQYYRNGQFAEAVQVWENALEEYQQQQGSKISQIQTLNYLALGYKDLGKQTKAQSMVTMSLDLLQSQTKRDAKSDLLLAQALNIQGILQLSQGQTQTALNTWEQAAKIYQSNDDQTGKSISNINKSQALQALGQYRRAKAILEQSVTELQKQPDNLIKAQGLRSLGIALQATGDLQQSKAVLEESWQLSKQLQSPTDVSAALFAIGNVARDLEEYGVAWTYYQESAQLSPDKLTQVEAQLNQLSMLVALERWQPALDLIPDIEDKLAQLSPSRPRIYAEINLAQSLTKISQVGKSSGSFSAINNQKTAQILAKAIQEAKQIQDSRAEAYSLHQLGKVYLEAGELADAQQLTQQSLDIAQTINAVDITARAASQLGKILTQRGEPDSAIAAYYIAFTNLQNLRSDLVAINSDIQFSFKESIEPIYRDYVSLLLAPSTDQGEVTQTNLKQAREVMEALQIEELDNFFRDACLDTRPVAIEEIDTSAAVIYPIILKDRLEVILSLPKQPLRHYTTFLANEDVEATVEEFYSSFSPGYPRDLHWQLSQQIYDWLIKPAEIDLNNNEIKTLVFIPDRLLRNIPMSALFDGDKYLIEKFSIALSPGLQLFPQGLQRQDLSMLAVGLTEARQGFNALPGVAAEIEEISQEVNTPEVLLNQNFTHDSFTIALNNQDFSIVHLATHGQFSSNPDETFLLTWSDRISLQDFDLLFQKRRVGILKPIELLVMSACQTAEGDDRATLGLAGFALRSGARSTLGSLWPVSDEATSELMIAFYQQLATGKISKAEALRQAQIRVMRNPVHKHPYFWSSFVLIGNWL